MRSLLRRVPLLQSFAPATLARLANVATRHDLQRGEPVYVEGDRSDRVYFTCRGRVRSTISIGGKVVTLAHYGPGELFGEGGLSGVVPREHSVRTTSPAIIAELPMGAFVDALRDSPEALLELARLTSRRCQALSKRLGELALRNVKAKRAGLGLELEVELELELNLARASGRESVDGSVIETPEGVLSSMPRGFGPALRSAILSDRYHLREFIGRGGSGNVYAAVDRRLQRRVAVKVIDPEYAQQEEKRLRIHQEALIGAQIAHVNVAQILDFGEEVDDHGDVLPFIVMPLLSGPTLRELILDGPIPWQTAGLWTHQLLMGLAALHERGVLHRDIKLDNCILVTESGAEVLKIIDLGLAKVTRDELLSRRPTSTAGVIIGSLPYLSPEQARGEEADERSDLYAAGVVLFELLTRRAPFVGTDYQVLSGHVEEPPPLPSVLAPLSGIPAALEEVTLRALTKKPDERYRSAHDFDIALVEALAQAGVGVGQSPAFAGCCEAQASLAAWTCFDYQHARTEAGRATRLNRAWSPLKLLMELTPEE